MKISFSTTFIKLVLVHIFLSISLLVKAQNVNIPDANFKAALVGNNLINTNFDTEIQVSEASAFSGAIDVSNLGISSLIGIEAFTSITDLNCSSNSIATLDISLNVSLLNLVCAYNQIHTLNLSNNANLKLINCASNQISVLNLALNYQLRNIRCDDNPINNLDLSSNTLINALYCNSLNLFYLDVSGLDSLAYFECSNNSQITVINMQNGNNANLLLFSCLGCPTLICLQVDNASYMNTNWAAAIDGIASYSTSCSCTINIPDPNFKAALLANTNINTNADAEIQCSEANSYSGAINVDNLGITDLTGIASFSQIDTLICTNNLLTNLDISSNTQLIYLCFSNNQLTNIDVSSNTMLVELCGQFNQLSSIDVSTNTALKYLYLSSNQLSSLDVSYNSSLWYLACSINNISTLDLTNCPELFEINCSNNQITSLDFSNNTDMYYVYCDNNIMTSIDLSLDTSLVILNCNNNNLSYLNIQNGNNIDFTAFNAINNANLTCIQVDDPAYMIANWIGSIDGSASYSTNCATCGVLPTPQFIVNTNNITTAPANVIFTNTTSNAGLYDFNWHFGDGGAIDNDNTTVNYTYNYNGNFNVSLTLTEPSTGCTSTNYDPNNSAQTIVCNVPTGNVCGFTPIVSPNGLINACNGNEVILTLNPGSYPTGSIIQWNKNGVTIIGENFPELRVTDDAYYTVTVFNASGCPVVSDPVQVQFTLPALTAPTISQTGTSGPCGFTNVTLTANGSFATYLWNNGQTGSSISVTQAGNYSVIGQGGVGCNYSSVIYPVSTSSFASPEICMVDVDSVNNHSVIVWEKPILTGILGFGIYKETSLYSENFQQIAIVPYDSLSEYIDINSDASIIAERYLLTIIDNCGGESAPSLPARAMGLKVYPGINNQRVLTWNYYVSSAQNFIEYNIYSGSSINNLNFLTTVPASINSNYIDANPSFGVNTVYRITANMIIPCESTRAARTRSISNGNGNFLTPYTVTALEESMNSNNLAMAIVPNPTNGIFKLSFENHSLLYQGHIYVFDMFGNIVFNQAINKINQIEVNLTSLASGVYNAKFVSGNKIVNKKLVINKE